MTNHRSKNQPELFWPFCKWLKIASKDSDYSADTDDGDSDAECDTEEFCAWPRELRFKDKKGNPVEIHSPEALPRSRRRKSETFRTQYINTKELKISVGTWNVGGLHPPDDLDIKDWLDISEPSDIYVIGFQEVIPLNAGNMFGSEDSSPIPKWEKIIRETLNKTQPKKTKFKCYSDPPSPSRFKPSDEAPDLEDEILLETDSDREEEILLLNKETNGFGDSNLGTLVKQELERQFSAGYTEESVPLLNSKLTKTLSGTERVGLSWPEPPLDLLAQCVSERPNSLRTFKSFKASKSFRTYNSFNSYGNDDNRVQSRDALRAELDLESFMCQKKRSSYVRIVSKQMVGVFLTIWVRKSLRKHIQNVNVSTVGVGVLRFLGNKGSISVSMSIYQTLFCFMCAHLSAGEKDGDVDKRNSDVHIIHQKTRFNSLSSIRLPKGIYDHERLIWLGDLNYRINLPYDTTRELISKKDWSKLVENDQLIHELRKGRAFDGWSEGPLNFPPTYKYELNSEKYYGEDPKIGRRSPAWCDRVLSFGHGMRLLSYKRTELRLSDHRPVTASYMVEVEVFSPRKLQKALTFTDAEIEDENIVADMGTIAGVSHIKLGEDSCEWVH